MDNNQIPQMQPLQSSPVGAAGQAPEQTSGQVPGQVVSQAGQTAVEPPKKRDVVGLIKTIAIIIVSLIAVTFIGLFIWMFMQYDEAQTDVDGKIALAVAEAKDEQALKDEEEFLEREKYPYRTFSGPADYGQLTFEYPKTWSVYVAADASKGGDYQAYFNPIQVNAVSNNTINALRLTIRDKDFESVTAEYQKAMDKKDSNLTVESITFNGITANRYTGTIPDSELSGYIVVFKIRDKTAILQTDSVLFAEDFNRLLETVEFNA